MDKDTFGDDISHSSRIKTKTTGQDNDINVRKFSSATTFNRGSQWNVHIEHQEEEKLLFKLDIHIAAIVVILLFRLLS